MEVVIIVSLVIVDFTLLAIHLWQRRMLNKAMTFLKDYSDSFPVVINTVEKCIDITNKNAELLLQTSEKANSIEDEVTRLKAVYDLTQDYFAAIEKINEARRVELSLSKRIYQLNKKEE